MDFRRLHFGTTMTEIVTTCIHALCLVTASSPTYALDASELAGDVLHNITKKS